VRTPRGAPVPGGRRRFGAAGSGPNLWAGRGGLVAVRGDRSRTLCSTSGRAAPRGRWGRAPASARHTRCSTGWPRRRRDRWGRWRACSVHTGCRTGSPRQPRDRWRTDPACAHHSRCRTGCPDRPRDRSRNGPASRHRSRCSTGCPDGPRDRWRRAPAYGPRIRCRSGCPDGPRGPSRSDRPCEIRTRCRTGCPPSPRGRSGTWPLAPRGPRLPRLVPGVTAFGHGSRATCGRASAASESRWAPVSDSSESGPTVSGVRAARRDGAGDEMRSLSIRAGEIHDRRWRPVTGQGAGCMPALPQGVPLSRACPRLASRLVAQCADSGCRRHEGAVRCWDATRRPH
jgi:hypothetical protein